MIWKQRCKARWKSTPPSGPLVQGEWEGSWGSSVLRRVSGRWFSKLSANAGATLQTNQITTSGNRRWASVFFKKFYMIPMFSKI